MRSSVPSGMPNLRPCQSLFPLSAVTSAACHRLWCGTVPKSRSSTIFTAQRRKRSSNDGATVRITKTKLMNNRAHPVVAWVPLFLRLLDWMTELHQRKSPSLRMTWSAPSKRVLDFCVRTATRASWETRPPGRPRRITELRKGIPFIYSLLLCVKNTLEKHNTTRQAFYCLFFFRPKFNKCIVNFSYG